MTLSAAADPGLVAFGCSLTAISLAELGDAAGLPADAAESGASIRGPGAVIWEAFVLVFLAELGDRTQFATIFLAAARCWAMPW